MDLNSVIVPVLLTFLSFLFLENKGYQYSVKTKKLECTSNPQMVYNFTCKLKPVNWHKSEADIEVYPIKPLANISMRFELFKYTNQFRPFLMNITLNLCRWFDKTERRNGYAKAFIYMMTQFTNVNHSCPYQGLLKSKGLYFNPQIAGFAIPAGTYMVVITGFEGYPFVHIGTMKFVLAVTEDEDIRNSSRRRLYQG